jgi:hypothetical protein
MITLYVNKFTCNDPERKAEFDKCLELNTNNPLIDKIVLINTEARPTYEMVFNMFQQDSVNILANSDIYFDDTIQFARAIGDREFFALTRWELLDNKVMFFTERHPGVPAKYSQDAWIVGGKPNVRNANFMMGVPGCDNRIARVIWDSGYIVRNPSYTIRAIHIHKKDYRDPNIVNDQIKPPYKWVEPTTMR